jgi:hypothetical protein
VFATAKHQLTRLMLAQCIKNMKNVRVTNPLAYYNALHLLRRHDIQQNDIQHNDILHNDIQHNDTQHNGLTCDTQDN